MSGIFGVINSDQKPVSLQDLEGMAKVMEHRGPDGHRIWRKGACGLGQLMLCSTPESLSENLPWTDPESGLVITADARLDARDELAVKLGVENQLLPDSQLILAAYRKWDQACVDHLLGDFAFVIVDPVSFRVFCARDHFGLKPFYYYLTQKSFVFASSARGVVSVSDVPVEIDDGRKLDFLLLGLEGVDNYSTFFRDVFRLPPAHVGVYDNGQWSAKRYWAPDPTTENFFASDEECVDAMEELLTQAIGDRLRSQSPVASMLSGGVDSSTIVAMVRNQFEAEGKQNLRTFSAVSREAGSLESRFIREVAGQGNLDAAFVSREQVEGCKKRLHDVFTALEDPFDTPMIMQMLLYSVAADKGARVMLDGNDGDLVASLSKYYPTWLLRSGELRKFIDEIHGRWENYYEKQTSLWVVYADMLKFFTVASLQSYRFYQPYSDWRSKQRLERTGKFNNPADLELAQRRLRHSQASCSHSLSNDLSDSHVKRLDAPYLTAGIERYGRVAAYCGIENRSPMLDKRFVEFCLGMPWNLKVRQGWTKFALRSVAGRVLPAEVAWRRDNDHVGYGFWEEWSALNKGTTPGTSINANYNWSNWLENVYKVQSNGPIDLK